jgi:hypothetical protein
MKERIIRLIKILSDEMGYIQFKWVMGDSLYDGIASTDDWDDFFVYVGDIEDPKGNILWIQSEALSWKQKDYIVRMLEEMLIES